jgi:hypothetical protein
MLLAVWLRSAPNSGLQALASWRQTAQYSHSVRQYCKVMTPDLATALETVPGGRTMEQIDLIYSVIQNYAFAQLIPVASLKICCRYMTYEVLHQDMVRYQHDLPVCTNMYCATLCKGAKAARDSETAFCGANSPRGAEACLAHVACGGFASNRGPVLRTRALCSLGVGNV